MVCVGLVLMFNVLTVKSQIKILSDSRAIYGAVSTGFFVKHHFVGGNTAFSLNSTFNNSAALIRGNNGFSSATTPDYTWVGSDITGIFHPSNDVIGFTLAGIERMRLTNTGSLLVGNFTGASSALIRGNNAFSSASNPDYSWLGSDITGIFHPSNDVIGFTLAGTERMRLTNAGSLLVGNFTGASSALIRGNNAFSSAANPDYSWLGNEPS